MKLYSTNHLSPQVTFREAVIQGMPRDNGLYIPVAIPKVDDDFLDKLPSMNLQDIAIGISRLWLQDEIEDDKVKDIVHKAFVFDSPLHKLNTNIYSLELFHGPTYAFKDFGARYMAQILSHFQQYENRETLILVATSGDTGSAVANGFLHIPGIYVVLLYPGGKVSELQEKQITTLNANVSALKVNGTFDDCQMMVKQAFLDEDLTNIMHLTSANSINIARLLPQSFYYFYAYGQLSRFDKPLLVSVPSGNLGNLCGGVLAKKMGLPIKKFVAATNSNHIFPHYLETGKFEPKPSVKTISNAMDVGNPSNFARILELYGNNHENVRKDITGYAYSDFITKKTIKSVFEDTNYLLCPHSAIGYLGLHDLMIRQDQESTGVFLSTAHPAKFENVINEFMDIEITIPHGLKTVMSKKKRAIPIESDYAAFKKFLLGASWRKS